MFKISNIKAFINGMREWNSDLTLYYDNDTQASAYDRGRYLMWRIKGREF